MNEKQWDRHRYSHLTIQSEAPLSLDTSISDIIQIVLP